ELLREAHERVVDRRVAVGMEIAHHLADDLGALAVGAVAGQAHQPHAVQHAAMRRLQAVADVRQRSSNDHAHGVIHVRPLHFVFDVYGNFGGSKIHIDSDYRLRATDYRLRESGRTKVRPYDSVTA